MSQLGIALAFVALPEDGPVAFAPPSSVPTEPLVVVGRAAVATVGYSGAILHVSTSPLIGRLRPPGVSEIDFDPLVGIASGR